MRDAAYQIARQSADFETPIALTVARAFSDAVGTFVRIAARSLGGRSDLAHLGALDNYLLADIGLTRADLAEAEHAWRMGKDARIGTGGEIARRREERWRTGARR